MAKIPEFLLRALYVKGSLINIEDGFEFKIKNELGPARVIGAQPLKIDRKPVPLNQCHFIHGKTTADFNDVSAENSVLMRKGEALTVRVQGIKLRSGRRTLGIGIIVKDLGVVNFSISDRVN